VEIEEQLIFGVNIFSIWNIRSKRIKFRFSETEQWSDFPGLADDISNATKLVYFYCVGLFLRTFFPEKMPKRKTTKDIKYPPSSFGNCRLDERMEVVLELSEKHG
jgi:hypothetical protein